MVSKDLLDGILSDQRGGRVDTPTGPRRDDSEGSVHERTTLRRSTRCSRVTSDRASVRSALSCNAARLKRREADATLLCERDVSHAQL